MEAIQNFFVQHPLRDLYTRKFGAAALRVFWISHYRDWFSSAYPEGENRILTVDDCEVLARMWQGCFNPEDVPRLLAIGEREQRWVLPNEGGLLTPEYWSTRLKDLHHRDVA